MHMLANPPLFLLKSILFHWNWPTALILRGQFIYDLLIANRSLHWTAEQKLKQGRQALLKNFIRENHDVLWAIDNRIAGLEMGDSVDSLMRCCDAEYKGNFQVMLRNLRHDASQVRRHSSVEAQMILRPPATWVIDRSTNLTLPFLLM
jgi:hypothetical protein